MFAVIRHYQFDPKNSAEIDRKVREGFVPLIRKAKGFVRYYWLDTGKGEGASFGILPRQSERRRVGAPLRISARPPLAAHSFQTRDHRGAGRRPRLRETIRSESWTCCPSKGSGCSPSPAPPPQRFNCSRSARRAITQLSHAIILSTGRRFIDVAI